MHHKIRAIVFGSHRSSISFILLTTFLMIFTLCNLVAAFDAPTSKVAVARSTPAALQSGGSFNITSSVIAGGGGKSTNGTTSLEGTIGQATLGASSGGNFTVNGGFWQSSPTSAVSISGQITYCAAAVPPGAPNVTLNLTGDTATSTSTNGTGNYSFTNLPGGGSFVVTPTKAGAISGISTADATRILQSLAGSLTLTTCQTTAADTSTNGSLSTADATHILNFLAGNPPVATNHTGEWRFVPASRSYVSINADQTSQNYDAILLGDNSGNWTPAGPSPQAAKIVQPDGAGITVRLPTASVASNQTNFSLPITVDSTTGLGVTGYRLRIVFNQAVVVPQATAFTTTGTLSNGWFVVANTSTPGVLIITAANASPLVGAGTLLTLNFTRTGAQGTSTTLQFQTAGATPGLQFEDANENIVPTVAVNGSITIGGAPTIATLSDFTANSYESGTQLRWQTAYETQNLGFNLYREVAGKRELINQNIVAGSALRASLTQPIAAGEGYIWWDNAPVKNAAYWLEDLDLNGNSTWHGPFYAKTATGKSPLRSRATSIDQLGVERGQSHSSNDVEAVALAAKPATVLNAKAKAGKVNAQAAVKLVVKHEGWYRVNQPELVAGLANDINANKLQLLVDGQEIPIAVTTNADGQFDENSYIEFYGMGLDSAASDGHVYWLTLGNSAGKRIKKVEKQGQAANAKSFAHTIERRDRTIYFSSLLNGERENFFGAVVGASPVDQTLNLRNLAADSSESAILEVALQGVSAIAHRVQVHLNDNLAGFINFNGQQNQVEKFNLPQALLREGTNVVRLTAQNGASDVSLVDSIHLTYQHAYKADNDKLKFKATSGEQLTVGGFTNQQIRVFDVTEPDGVMELVGKIEGQKDGFTISVSPKMKGERTLLALASGQESRPVSLKVNTDSRWRTTGNAADFVIITAGNFFTAFEPLRQRREAEGMRVAVVDVEDIFDEFNFGNKSPQAIKDFLAYAKQNWQIAPRFVLFAGDASYDPKNYLGLGDLDLVPTKLLDTAHSEAASDDWFSDFNNDGIADMATGRLSARNVGEAANLIAKQIRFEQGEIINSALLVSDMNDGFDFEAASSQLRALLSPGMKVTEVKRGQLDEATAKARLFEALNQGQKIVNYTGHGSVDLWRGSLLTSSEARELTNERLPMMVMMTCLNGYFNDPALDSLAENLLKAERGGAVAAWASSGLSFPQEQALMNQHLYRLLFTTDGQVVRLGEATQKAKSMIEDLDVRKTWVLLGDPTLRWR
jgi:hypothetical protein